MDLTTVLWYLLIFYILYKFLDFFIRLPKISGLNSRYVLVTGCDSGFGNATAKRLDSMGYNVIACCLTEHGETDLRKLCSDKMKTIHIDVSKPESVEAAYQVVEKILPQGSGLWGIINNAGVAGTLGPSDWLSLEDYHNVMSVNVYGLINVTHTFMPLVKKTQGRIVNTASIFGRHSMSGNAPYCVSKYAVEAYSDALRREMRVFKVSVHIIEPGFHKTNMTACEGLEESLRSCWNCQPQRVKDEYGQEFLEGSIQTIIKSFVSGFVSEDINPVVDAYTQALTAMFPRPRYVVGRDAKYLWLSIQALPESIADYLLEKMFAMYGPLPMPAACKK